MSPSPEVPMRLFALIAAASLIGCRTEKDSVSDTADPYYDRSEDSAGVDDTGRSPDDTADDTGESGDTVAGDTGDSGATTLDADGDGYDAPGEDPDTSAPGDCDDDDPDVNPGADERCDGIDNDCDGDIDESGAIDAPTWYADADDDGFGDDDATVVSCDPPEGYAGYGGDCDDADAAYNPGAEEADCADPNDYNCDGSVGYADEDGDGFAACEECDDADAAAYPGADERCDDADNDCDGDIDESDAIDASTWYADADADGFGDPASTEAACDQPAGYEDNADDCDDADDGVNPLALEVCDGVDQDCDGGVDEGAVDASEWYGDGDGDGYGDATSAAESCDAPSGYVADDSDCDDGDAETHPGAAESCDEADDDCDGDVDEDAADALDWYTDGDGDGYGDALAGSACDAPSGTAAVAGDCDDGDAAMSPGAAEVCDEADNDCDGGVDDGAADLWYADGDGDGYGDASSAVEACEAPEGYVGDDGVTGGWDCDDGDPAANPAAIWFLDYDGDGYGDADWSLNVCAQPSGYVDDSADCVDTDAGIYPGASESCDGADEDCDGATDEGYPADIATFYVDADGDGYGDAGASVELCEALSGYVSDDTDCDDGEATVHPGADELCDDLDNDCDGVGDLLGYWPFEAGSGSVAYDYGELELDGTISFGTWTTGYVGSALEFDGSASNVLLDYDELAPEDRGLTISAWVYPYSLDAGSWDTVVSRGAESGTSLSCCRDPYWLGYYLEGGTFYTDTESFSTPLQDGEDHSGHVDGWHHLMATWDMETGARAIYVDGVLTASDSYGPSSPTYDGAPTRIGTDTNNGAVAGSITFDGVIDEVKIFGCAVDADAAALDYADNWPF